MLGMPDAAVGAIAAALIAGLVSLLGLIISKEQKVSEFRQAWIDSLRDDIATIIARVNAIHGAMLAGYPNPAERWKVIKDDFIGINEAAARAKLRLNPKEEGPAKSVLGILEEQETIFNSGAAPDFVRLAALEKKLVAEAQILLKQEWKRVRSGELTYRIARIAAALVVATAIVLALFWGYSDIFATP
jgi:hypothetical protein